MKKASQIAQVISEQFLSYYKCREVELFRRAAESKQASEQQRLAAAQNMFYTLVSLPSSIFSGISYDEELDWVKAYLEERNEYTAELSQYEDVWIPVDTIPDPDTLEEGMEVHAYQVYSGFKIYRLEDGSGIQTQPVYTTKYAIYRAKTEDTIPELKMLFD